MTSQIGCPGWTSTAAPRRQARSARPPGEGRLAALGPGGVRYSGRDFVAEWGLEAALKVTDVGSMVGWS